MNSRDLLSAVRQAQGLPSNYALARRLGVTDKTVTRWNVGSNTPDDATAAHLAELAGFDPDMVVASMHAQRAHDDRERARWTRIADRLAHAGLGVLAFFSAILAMWTTGDPDGGASLALAAVALPVDYAFAGLYIVVCLITWRALNGARLQPIASHA